MPDFKPQIMPLMYWALAYGAAAGILLFILWALSSFITVVWFPVFLVGVIWGGWRNYQQQKKRWYTQAGVPQPRQSPIDEFRQAAADIATSSQELLNQNEAEPLVTDTTPELAPTTPESDQDSAPPSGR